MQPILNVGDIVIVKEINDEKLIKQGDIISFRNGQNVITHRIYEVIENNNKKEYRTKGDNNNTVDNQLITYNEIEGKVVSNIPYAGNISLLLQDKIIIIFIVIIFYINLVHTNKISLRKEKRNIKRLRHEKEKYHK